MMLPSADRVIYKVNPLDPVICQVRFPTILKVTATEPYEFQELIRPRFPRYERAKPQGLSIPEGTPPEISDLLTRAIGPLPHKFLTSEGSRYFVLETGSLSLTVHDYEQWEEFKSDLFLGLDALQSVYRPDRYSRIGLRYINMISRSQLNLLDVPWSDLLNPTVLGAMSEPSFGGLVTATAGQFEAVVNGMSETKLKVAYGLVPVPRGEGKNAEQVFKLDIDFGTTAGGSHDHSRTILDEFNKRVRGIFHWAIKEQLHNAMGPRGMD